MPVVGGSQVEITQKFEVNSSKSRSLAPNPLATQHCSTMSGSVVLLRLILVVFGLSLCLHHGVLLHAETETTLSK